MTAWPSSPTWIDLTKLNNGKQFTAQSYVTADLINKIVNNILCLKSGNYTVGGST